MKNVVLHIGDTRFLDVAQRVLCDAREVAVETVGDASQVLDRPEASTVILTDLPQAEESWKQLRPVEGEGSRASVVLVTTPEKDHLAVRALREGAASYVPGALLESELVTTLDSVFAVASAHQDRSRIMDCIAESDTHFVLENNRLLIGPLVRYIQETSLRMGLFDHNEQTRLGIAFEEALVNSMYHGNLEVPSALREEDEGAFYRLIESRAGEQPYASRRIRIRAHFGRDRVELTVQDEGGGFDASSVPDPTDPANVERLCGRGLLLMKTFMDEVDFNERGNRVTLTKRVGKKTQ